MDKNKIEDLNLDKLTFPKMTNSTRISYSSRDVEGLLFYFKKNGRKEWHFRYTRPTDKRRTSFKLGNYPIMSYEEAKDLIVTHRSNLNKGIDPVEHKKLERINKVRLEQSIILRSDNQFNFNTCSLKFLEHCEKKELSIGTIKRYKNVINKYIIPEMGAWDVRIFDYNSFVELLFRIKEDYTSTAAHLFKTTRAILSYLVEEGIIRANPLYGRKDLLKKISVTPRERSLNSHELHKFYKELDERPYSDEVKFALRLMFVNRLACRRGCSNALFKHHV